ncbi:MAG TPA: malate dehydrogenase [Oligoflexia bacterium]|nr:malate dehydrogenase [Oligoflexia bacterium]HMP27842.1 malate dehydrogenase [Oligoflexia bacterium]
MSQKNRKKIALIGAGQIGGTLGLLCGMRSLGDVVLYDVVEGMPQGKALDLSHLAAVFGLDFSISGTNKLEDIAGSDLCIVTSGLPRKPGMTREDLVKINGDIIRQVADGIKKYAPNSFVIVVTNPLDAMVYLAWKTTGFPSARVVGMAGVLDSARYEAFLSEALKISNFSISAMVMGGHGDEMVAVRSLANASGVPVSKFLSADQLDGIEKRVAGAGGEIVALLKTGSAFYSPAAAATLMAESYLFDRKNLLTASALCQGQYGVNGIYFGVPVVIGAGGVEKIVEIELSSQEKSALMASAAKVKTVVELL